MLAEELSLAVTVAAISLSRRLEAEDTALLGTVLTQLGDTLATIATAKTRLEQAETQTQPEDKSAEPP